MIEQVLLENAAITNNLYPGDIEPFFVITYDASADSRVNGPILREVDEVIKQYESLETQGRDPRLYVMTLEFSEWDEYNPDFIYEKASELTGDETQTYVGEHRGY